MDNFIVAIFPDESKAYQGVRELKALHQEGSLTLYGTTVVARDAKGALEIKDRSDRDPWGTAVGSLVGALFGALGGPAGAIMGAAGGGLLGGTGDVIHYEVSNEFLEAIERELAPGKVAIAAEVAEDWIAPLNSRMEALGAKVIREGRASFVEDLLEKRARARREALEERKAERAGSKAERLESRLTEGIQEARKQLEQNSEKAKQWLGRTKEEMIAKLRALEDQASKAKPELRSRIDRRISDLRRDFQEREKKLARAVESIQEVLQK